jgi:hypothetical protein
VQDERPPVKRDVSWKLLAILALVLGALAFAPAMSGEFIYDDVPLIQQNPNVHGFAHWKRWFTTDFWDTTEENRRFGRRIIYFRPAISASYALDWKIGDGDPFVFHVTNLLWNAAASLLAYLALRRWLGAAIPAFVAAALFILHPTKAESVAWIAGRTDVFCLVAVLLAAEGMARRMRGQKGGLPLEIGATVLAYLMKEQAVILPVFAAVETWVLLGRPAIDLEVVKRSVRAAIPQLIVALAYLSARNKWMPIRGSTSSSVSTADYLSEVAESLGRYAELTFFPHDLSVQQGLIQTSQGRMIFNVRYIVLGVVFVVALIAIAIAARRRAPALTVGVAFYLVTLLPTSNIVPMQMAAMVSERFLYMPILGLAFALGFLMSELGERRQRIAFALAGCCSLAFLVVSMRRSDDYVDRYRFWARELSLRPDSLEPWRYAVGDAITQKRYPDALRYLMRGTKIAAKHFAHTGMETDFIIQAADALAVLTPDLDEKDLQELDRFYADAMLPEPGDAFLTVGPAHIRVPRGGPAIHQRLSVLQPLTLFARAQLASRRGDDRAAFAFAHSALEECPRCFQHVSGLAVVYARAGDYGAARRILDDVAAYAGPETVKEERATIDRAELYGKQAALAQEGPLKLQLRALELSTLDAWGRAYAVLRDHKEEIKKAPGFAFGFAELAFRAGDTKTAREVLAAIMPEEKIEPTFREWSKKMGWL